jgi:hypothetical protein
MARSACYNFTVNGHQIVGIEMLAGLRARNSQRMAITLEAAQKGHSETARAPESN